MKGASQSAVRAQLGRFGFAGQKATTAVGKLSGGERARLALALITRDAPHMLILDEPTNHLDVDAREALIQALNAYTGAVLIVSHDRHMIEMTADRLVLVDRGTAREFDGSLDDYIAFILSDGATETRADKAARKASRPADPAVRAKERDLRRAVETAEATVLRLSEQRDAIDRAMIDPATADRAVAKLSREQLTKRRAELEAEVEAAELAWLEASGAVETLAA
jgi:ATP-binding cassette subfamily F protein 3